MKTHLGIGSGQSVVVQSSLSEPFFLKNKLFENLLRTRGHPQGCPGSVLRSQNSSCSRMGKNLGRPVLGNIKTDQSIEWYPPHGGMAGLDYSERGGGLAHPV